VTKRDQTWPEDGGRRIDDRSFMKVYRFFTVSLPAIDLPIDAGAKEAKGAKAILSAKISIVPPAN
jgi:hypothetical protein